MYKTKDLSLASMLCSFDCKLVEYTIDDLNQFWFYFEDSETLSSLAKSFYLSTATANIQKFTACQKMLKSLIHKNRKVIDENNIRYSSRRKARELCVG